jgi:Bifunctional DNA primase/polymerase, N-terminal/Primase C terminal 1 (PriCT-1)
MTSGGVVESLRPAPCSHTGPFAAALELRGRGLFPIPLGGKDGKKPLIAGFTKIRKPSFATVKKLVDRFPQAAIGIVTGASDLVVVDIDSDDPAAWATVIELFGDTPLKIRTPSGGLHLYYRSNGERNRNLRPALPVDVKGTGGLVAAPPSVRLSGTHRGKAYAFCAGSWDDLIRLPRIKPGALETRERCAPRRTDKIAPAAVPLRAVGTGRRNNTLWRTCMWHAPDYRGESELFALALEINTSRFKIPLAPAEVAKLVHSAWGYEVSGKNRIGRRRVKRPPSTALDAALAKDPDAGLLLRVVRHAFGALAKKGRLFPVSPRAMAEARTIREWGASDRRYRRALAVLLQLGLLIIVHPGGRRKGDANLYRFGNGDRPMSLQLVKSNAVPPPDADLMRVVDALKSGLSIRKAGKTLSLDKSKILRLKIRATSMGLLQASHAEALPNEVSRQSGVPGVSPADAVSKKEDTPPALLPPRGREGPKGKMFEAARPYETQVFQAKTHAAVSIPLAESGCLVRLPDGSGGYTQCYQPVCASSIFFCREHA